jgi:hypothetical protein
MLTGHLIAYNLTKWDWYTAAKDNAYQIPFDYLGQRSCSVNISWMMVFNRYSVLLVR